MSDLTLPDDLKEWQDALDDRDLARWLYDSCKVDLRAKAFAAERLILCNDRLERLRKEHMSSPQVGLEIESREESELPELVPGLDEIYGIYSEDEYHDNRERGRTNGE